MTTMTEAARTLVVGVLVLGTGCATPPKPRELVELEGLRQKAFVAEARERAPGYYQQAEGYYRQATEALNDNEPEQAREYSLLALMKLKTAEALVRQARAEASIKETRAKATELNTERSRVDRMRIEIEEKNALIEKLQAQGKKLSQGQANEAINAAKLALKTAESVMAARFAETEFKLAGEMLAKAEAELGQGQFGNATATAQLAKEKADKAFNLSKVQYQQTQEAAAARARNEALLKDASAIAGVQARREQAGELQKVVLPLLNLFRGRATKIRPEAQPLLTQVANLMKKYPTYQVIIEGHTDRYGHKGALLALSQTRAAAVHEALLTQGVQAKRMTVTGYGGERPVSPQRSKNNRVEIVFVLQ